MSWQVVWTSNATSGLRDAAQAREDLSPGSGPGVVDAVFDRVSALGDFPLTAPRLARADDDRIQRLVFKRFLVIYRVIEARGVVQVLAGRHLRQRPLGPDDLP